jgi:aryl-alcohol dehydrogenase-like predicted oxidoreductase/3-hydroxyisobutyrate dehydrogenase-like beta-hydroxyacid dehydrogenase
MNVCHAYGPAVSEDEAKALFFAALDAGVNHFDTAALYGFGLSERLIGQFLSAHRQSFTLASKCGMQGVDVAGQGKKVRVIDGRPETIKATCGEALERLKTDFIDLYYLHRWDRRVPIEESVGALADLQREGKIRAIGLSEVSADTLRRAHAVAPIAALQTEYSLWTRNPEQGVLQACRELGVSFVAFSPLGRGFLTSHPPSHQDLAQSDIRRTMPRFLPGLIERNAQQLEALAALSQESGHTVAQLSLAWLLAQGDDILPIPGTRKASYLLENVAAAEIELSAELIQRLGQCFAPAQVAGHRYGAAAQVEVDTEDYRRLGIVGFGEVGQIFAQGLLDRAASVTVFDIKLQADHPAREALLERAESLGVTAVDSMAALCARSDFIISAVTASNALAVAQLASASVEPGSIFLDLNSASPGTKQQAAAALESAGAQYVEAGVMTSVPPYGIRVPMLVGGQHAEVVAQWLTRWGMAANFVSTDIGVASATKMSRSIMIKGLEALVIESFSTARYYGVEEAMVATLKETFPGVDWPRQAAYFFMRVAQHGQRRAEEMRESAQTVSETGFPPLMASAISEKHQWIADLAADGVFDFVDPNSDWQTWADALLAAKSERTSR